MPHWTHYGLGPAVLIGLGLGVLFPGTAAVLAADAVYFLAVLLFASSLVSGELQLADCRPMLPSLLWGLICCFVAMPVLAIALSHTLALPEYHRYGLLFCALCPSALVGPLFTRWAGGKPKLSLALLFLTMVLSPAVIPPMLHLLSRSQVLLPAFAMSKLMLLACLPPFLAAKGIQRIFPAFAAVCSRWSFVLTATPLILLIFALSGSSYRFMHVELAEPLALFKLLGALLVVSFSPIILVPLLLPPSLRRSDAATLAISLCMKNVAVAAAFLLVVQPRSTLVPTLGFAVNALLFSITPWLFNKRPGKQEQTP